MAPLPDGDVTPERVLGPFRTAAPAEHGATVLVAHSNAGYYAPAVAADLDLPVIFMDAALPAAGGSETLLAPRSVRRVHRDAAPAATDCSRRGRAWWDRADVAALFPDEDWLDRVTREAPRLAPGLLHDAAPRAARLGGAAGGIPRLRRHVCRGAGLRRAGRLGGASRRRPPPARTSPSPTAWRSSSSTFSKALKQFAEVTGSVLRPVARWATAARPGRHL